VFQFMRIALTLYVSAGQETLQVLLFPSVMQCLTHPRMLEDASYQDIVRWSDMGDSFVVVDVHLHFLSPLPLRKGIAHNRLPSKTSLQRVFYPDISNIPISQVLSGN